MNGFRAMLAGVALIWAVSAAAQAVTGVQPLLEFDMANWDSAAGNLPNSGNLPAAQALRMTPGTGMADWAPSIPSTAFGVPEYVSGGAGPLGRPYLSFEKYGYLAGSTYDQSIFNNNPDGIVGYTMVGYLRVDGLASATTGGIGVAQSGGGNLFLYTDGTGSLYSNTAIYDVDAPNYRREEDFNTWHNITGMGILPAAGTWFQFVKVFDVMNQEILYYVNGVLACDPIAFDFHAQRGDEADIRFAGGFIDHIGDVGTNGSDGNRAIKGLDYSYFAAYDCPLTADQVMQSYMYLTTGVPEPATMTLLVLGGAAMLRRRK